MPANGSRLGTATARSVRVAVAVGLALLIGAVVLVLSEGPPTVAGTNSVPAHPEVAYVKGGYRTCEMGGTLPAGTSAIRLSASANTGPMVTLRALSGGRLVTSGHRASGWGVEETVTVPVRRVPRTIADVKICLTFGPVIEDLQINGAVLRTTVAGKARKAVALRLEYLRPGHRSWWSLASSVARHMGLGHAPSGTWIVLLLILIMITIAALAVDLVLWGLSGTPPAAARAPAQGIRGRLRRIPRAAWICALIASANAACWSVITPPFQLPDEPAHFAYVQQLAEKHALPKLTGGGLSEEEEVALTDLRQEAVQWHPEVHTIATTAEQRHLEADLAQPLPRSGSGDVGVANSQPPLYYALETIPYLLGSGGNLLIRLELMRLLSALMAGLTALFAYLFVREVLPGAPWAWVVGGLGVALAPLLGFMSGAVTPEGGLYAISAATFYVLARAFRRGLTPSRAVAIGIVVAIGVLTKDNFIGLIPGVIFGMVVLVVRAARTSRRTALLSLALAAGIAVSPVVVYVVSNVISHHPALGVVSSSIKVTSGRGHVLEEISYIWQSYLPRLPGMTNYFPGISTTIQMWFDRSVGFYGWNDTSFPLWVDDLALVVAGLLAILAARALIVVRATLRLRVLELGVYGLMAVGLLALIGASSYLVPEEAGTYSEPRYLLPLLSLLGAALVLSARGAGRRWGPAAGAVIVVLFLAHDVFSQLQVIARFYG